MITLQNISKAYEIRGAASVTALVNVDLEITEGEFLVIIGRSGSGKTTLLNIAAGLTRPTGGKVLLDGTDLWSMCDREQTGLRNRKLGFVFQFPSLIPTLSALENVMLPVSFSDHHKDDGRARAIELLQTVGLGDRLASWPRQMSAGQQQRVVIARALMNRPQVLLADEPSSDLDEETEKEIMSLFSDIHSRTGVTIMMVTHTRQLIAYGTRAVEMAAGRLREIA